MNPTECSTVPKLCQKDRYLLNDGSKIFVIIHPQPWITFRTRSSKASKGPLDMQGTKAKSEQDTGYFVKLRVLTKRLQCDKKRPSHSAQFRNAPMVGLADLCVSEGLMKCQWRIKTFPVVHHKSEHMALCENSSFVAPVLDQ